MVNKSSSISNGASWPPHSSSSTSSSGLPNKIPRPLSKPSEKSNHSFSASPPPNLQSNSNINKRISEEIDDSVNDPSERGDSENIQEQGFWERNKMTIIKISIAALVAGLIVGYTIGTVVACMALLPLGLTMAAVGTVGLGLAIGFNYDHIADFFGFGYGSLNKQNQSLEPEKTPEKVDSIDPDPAIKGKGPERITVEDDRAEKERIRERIRKSLEKKKLF